MKKLNRSSSLFEDCGYELLMMLAQAVEKANSITDTDKIREALLNINYDGVRGRAKPLSIQGASELSISIKSRSSSRNTGESLWKVTK